MQYGPLQLSPIHRSKEHLRFRLIDFGRTTQPEADQCYAAFSNEYGRANEHLKLEYY